MVKAVGAGVVALASLSTAFYVGYRMAKEGGSSGAVEAKERKGRKEGDEEDEELYAQQFKRCVSFLGEEGFGRVREAHVVVVGAGGVGSHAAHMLARSGVGKLTLIDFDQVTLSSLNRHATATWRDVGKPKVVAMAEAFAASCPSVEVVPVAAMFTGEVAGELLAGRVDFVVDAIDNRVTKVDLLMYCAEHDIPVISSMGAGARADPSRIRLADVMETSADPLAKRMRGDLRKRGLKTRIPCVFSTEKAGQTLAPLPEEVAAEPDEYSLFPELNFRVSIIPVLGMIPAMFGNALAAYVVTEIGRPVTPVIDTVVVDGEEKRVALSSVVDYAPHKPPRSDKFYAQLFSGLRQRGVDTTLFSEQGAQDAATFPDLSVADVRFVAEEMWDGVSARRSNATKKLGLFQWDPSKPALAYNLVLMTRKEGKALMEVGMEDRVRRFGGDWVVWVESRLAVGYAHMCASAGASASERASVSESDA